MKSAKYEKRLERIQRHNEQLAQRRALREIKRHGSMPHRRIETNKLIALYLFALLNAIVIYSMVAMWKLGDLSYLGALISDIAAQVLVYAIYCAKAYAGKKQEEQLKFERDKLFLVENDEVSPDKDLEDEEE